MQVNPSLYVSPLEAYQLMSCCPAEYYGVGMLIYQFLHREDRCYDEGVQFTLKATLFKRYEKARSKEELDAADRTVLRWGETSEKLCERLDGHPLHGRSKTPNMDTARDRFMERVYVVLRIGSTNGGRDKWFIVLDEYETQQKNPGVMSQGPSSDKTRHTSEMGGTASGTTPEGTTVEIPPTTIGLQEKDV